jgi:hypothetical protein
MEKTMFDDSFEIKYSASDIVTICFNREFQKYSAEKIAEYNKTKIPPQGVAFEDLTVEQKDYYIKSLQSNHSDYGFLKCKFYDQWKTEKSR